MSRFAPFAVAILVLTGCVSTNMPAISQTASQSASQGAPIIIRNDHGGNVAANIVKRQQLAASGRQVQLRGFCDSACTMFTTLPNACLAPNATFGFHAPSLTGTKTQAPLVGDLIGQFYRNGIKRKWDASWSKSTKISRISAKQYVALDPQARLCAK